jgi:hypothetical protein
VRGEVTGGEVSGGGEVCEGEGGEEGKEGDDKWEE